MPKKQKPQFQVNRTLAFEVVLRRSTLEGFLVSLLDELVSLRPGVKSLGVGVKHPLVETVKRLSKEYDCYGDDLLEHLKPTDEELTSVAALIPQNITVDFLDALRNYDDGETDDFHWDIYPTQVERAQIINTVSGMLLTRLQAVLKEHDDERKEQEAEDAKREQERQLRLKDAAAARLRDAEAVLTEAGYTITPPVKKHPARKKAK